MQKRASKCLARVNNPDSGFAFPLKWWHLQQIIASFWNHGFEWKLVTLCPDSLALMFLVMPLHGIFFPLQFILSVSHIFSLCARKAFLPHSPTVSRLLYFCLEQPIGLTQPPKRWKKYLQISLSVPCLTLKAHVTEAQHCQKNLVIFTWMTFFAFWGWEKSNIYCTRYFSAGATHDVLLMTCWAQLGELGYVLTLLSGNQKPQINSTGKSRNMKFPSKTTEKKSFFFSFGVFFSLLFRIFFSKF